MRLKLPSDLAPYENHCYRILGEERFKKNVPERTGRTFRYRMARGMLENILQVAHKRKLRSNHARME